MLPQRIVETNLTGFVMKIATYSTDLTIRSILVRFGIVFMSLLVGSTGMTAMAQGKFAELNSFVDEAVRTVDHSAWDTFLGEYTGVTDDNRNIIRYGDVSSTDKTALNNYISSLEAIDPTELTNAQAYAFWVNLYNAITVDLILENYPLKSIRDIGLFKRGPWDQKITKINGKDLTLNNIEHNVLRVFWSDPRTHYAVNCASFGCPNLQEVAYTAENTNALLDKGARDFVNHPRGINVDDRGRVNASSIYNWYKVDFGGNAEGILSHVRIYADEDLKAALAGKTRINSYDYGWNLNEK